MSSENRGECERCSRIQNVSAHLGSEGDKTVKGMSSPWEQGRAKHRAPRSVSKTPTRNRTPKTTPKQPRPILAWVNDPDSYTGANHLYKQGLEVPQVSSNRVKQESTSTFCVLPRSTLPSSPGSGCVSLSCSVFAANIQKCPLFLACFTRLSSSRGLFLPLLAIQPWVCASPILCTYQYF